MTHAGVTDANRKWWILGAMGAVMCLILIDETVVAVAMPTIRTDLGISQIEGHWVINAYLLAFASFAAAGGKFGDIFGHGRSFFFGLTIFALASLACGFAPDGEFLIAMRALQGLGAAIIFPISLTMITMVFPPEQRGKAFGFYAAIGTTALAFGPLVGGFFTEVFSWRWIFWINPPLAVAVAGVVLIAWRQPARAQSNPPFDRIGFLSLSAGLTMLVFAVMQGPDWSWTNPVVLGLFFGGAAVLWWFVRFERRHDNPLLDLTLFNSGTFTVSVLTIFQAQFNQMAIVVFGALYFQDVLKMGPLLAGVALLAGVGAAPVAGVPTGALVDRIGARPVVLGSLALTAIALLWIGVGVRWESYLLIVPGFLAWGTSNCALYSAPRRSIMNGMPAEKQGQASGIAMTGQLLGGTVGVAVCGTVYTMTSSFTAVFLIPAALSFLSLLLAWKFDERPRASTTAP